MKPEQWPQIQQLFQAALERDPEQRAAFLEQACGADRSLHREITSLLAAHAQADSFLETQAYQLAAAAAAQPGLAPGATIGPYRILGELGRGGMGIVYLAEDTRLGREVALKALAAEAIGDPAREERLRREARAAARLSHPAIATVYALEELEGQLYIACELVRGRTLRAELESAGGALPLPTVLEIAIAVAEGLAAAHREGIVHRDLKPENIVRSESGATKILDFGLARFTAPPTTPEQRLTQSGVLLGTPAYMAPEQLQGRETDFRGDLFAFGVLLYELASGVHPFEGHSPLSTAARILESEPPPLPGPIPAGAGLDRIIRRCVRKRPEERYASTAELVRELRALEAGAAGSAAPTPAAAAAGGAPNRQRRWWKTHQVAVVLFYALMAWSAWQVKEWKPGAVTLGLFFAAVLCAAVSGTLRLHLLFTARHQGVSLARQLRRVQAWMRRCDWTFTAVLAAMAAALATARPLAAALIAAAAIVYLIVFIVIEPATTRAAFSGRKRPAKT
ncbi:MAG TPA: serine/threonine-protein kinase [Acidobacteriota bacterium]